jgi:solute carrier family 25 thiamine pyrophosphate transporter 19
VVPGALPPTAAGAASSSSPLQPAFTPKYRGLGHAFATILREEGVAGLWRGTVPGVLLAVPYTAVQFVALQQVRAAAARWLGPPPPPPSPPQPDANAKKTASSRRLHLRRNPDALPPPTPPPPPRKAHPPWVTPAVSFASGALAGAAGTVASYPFDLLRTTLAAQGEPRVYRGMFDAARGICRNGGPKALYRGLGVTLVEIVPYAALQFGLYDALNAAWRDAAERRSSAAAAVGAAAATKNGGGGGAAAATNPPFWTWYESDRLRYFACGLAAGLAAKLATHPLDVAKKRYQVAGLQRSLSYGRRVDASLPARSLGQCLGDIWRREGVRGLWKGSVPSVVKAAPAAAVTFVAYEAVAAWLLAAATAANAASREREEAKQVVSVGKGGKTSSSSKAARG